MFKDSSPEYREYAELWNHNAKVINQDRKEQVETFLKPLVADRDRLQSKIEHYDQEKHKKLNQKLIKTSKIKREINDLDAKNTDLRTERNQLIAKYDLKIKTDGTHPNVIVYMLNELINHFFERFKQVKSSLIKQIGTIERAQEFNKVENLKRTPQKTSKRG